MLRDALALDAVGDLAGLRVLITGGNSGIGLEAGRLLAARGAHVTLTSRDVARGDAAAADIRASHPDAQVDVLRLDLADLAAVEQAADEAGRRLDRLDVLVNNAGVMALPYRQTADGFEVQLGTNHLGHFALTGHLLEVLLAAPAPRVVTVSSQMHRIGRLDFDNLDGSRGYDKWAAYGASKLANLLFAFELQRRSEAAGAALQALAAHPGYASTNLQVRGPEMEGARLKGRFMGLANRVVAQSARAGAQPTVVAAASPQVEGGEYVGPRGPGGWRGKPTRVTASRAARDQQLAARLWAVSEELTGVRFDWPA